MPIRTNSISHVTIDGCEFLGIEGFASDDNALKHYIHEEASRLTKSFLHGEFTATVKINKIIFYKLIGIWDWVMKYCPNRHLVHLMNYAKNPRTRDKNFYRALNTTCEMIAYYNERNKK